MNIELINFLDLFKKYTGKNFRYGVLITIILIIIFFRLEVNLEESLLSDYIDYNNLYLLFSYTLIVLCILLLHIYKNFFFFDGFSLWLIVVGCLVRQHTEGHLSVFTSYYLTILGVIFSLYILKNRKQFKYPKLTSIFTIFAWSLGTLLLLAMLGSIFVTFQSSSLPINLPIILFVNFFSQLSFVTIIEEMLFRGIFVCFLMMNGHKENIAFVIQAVLFWIMHFIQFNYGFVFFVFIPTLTLSLTLAVKKQKMLYGAIIIHTVINVFASPLAILLKSYF